jgi:putative flavoprotein involved in K+ transport
MPTHVDVVVIGGGQAGLATAYFLRRAGIDYIVLDNQNAAGRALTIFLALWRPIERYRQ